MVFRFGLVGGIFVEVCVFLNFNIVELVCEFVYGCGRFSCLVLRGKKMRNIVK